MEKSFIIKGLRELVDKEDVGSLLPNTFEWRKISVKSRLMAMMLNGELAWDKGIRMRETIDELSEEDAK